MAGREAIEETLSRLRSQVEAAVREEQLRDQLTGLANGAGLTEDLTQLLGQGEGEFWVAFIEVDRFKRINDEFGYEAADALLKAIAVQLETARLLFHRGARAYRAHGDEFFLIGGVAGDADIESIAQALAHLCQGIARIRLPVSNHHAAMSCTVTVGWSTAKEARAHVGAPGLTYRALMTLLETTVGAAKRRSRGTVLMFGPDVEKLATFTLRSDCAECSASFSVDVPREDRRADALRCPNCGAAVDRPPRPPDPPKAISV